MTNPNRLIPPESHVFVVVPGGHKVHLSSCSHVARWQPNSVAGPGPEVTESRRPRVLARSSAMRFIDGTSRRDWCAKCIPAEERVGPGDRHA